GRARSHGWRAASVRPSSCQPSIPSSRWTAALTTASPKPLPAGCRRRSDRMSASSRHWPRHRPALSAGRRLRAWKGRHRGLGGNTLRSAVLGANDGLCSNLSLVMGVAGADLAPHGILVTGLAGLLAGACSMALGEWLSISTTRESYQRQIKTEA